MRIPGNVYSNQQISTRADRAGQAGKAEQARGDAKAEGARSDNVADVSVEVSSKAKRLANDNAMDVAKVARLQAAIAGGTFAIDARAIAATITESGG